MLLRPWGRLPTRAEAFVFRIERWTGPVASPRRDPSDPGGWTVFAFTALLMGSLMKFLDAAWSFAYKGSTPDLEDSLFGRHLKTYGWVWLVVALILAAAAFGLLARSQLSRWIGIVAGGIAAVSAVAWLPYYPVWSLTYILIGGLVVYALAVHGGRTERAG
jgi:hypothetical protein